MPEYQTAEKSKCTALQLSVYVVWKLEEYKTITGKSKNAILVELIREGLDSS